MFSQQELSDSHKNTEFYFGYRDSTSSNIQFCTHSTFADQVGHVSTELLSVVHVDPFDKLGKQVMFLSSQFNDLN